jgi:hypothetical protein
VADGTYDCKKPAFVRRSPSGRRGTTERTLTEIGLAPAHYARTVLSPGQLDGLGKCVVAIGASQVCCLQSEQLRNPPGFTGCLRDTNSGLQRLSRVFFNTAYERARSQPVDPTDPPR